MRPKVDTLGPENMIGFVPGLLTGTKAPMASKYMVVTKSPLTNTWGDANSGGMFGLELKAAGYDGIFFTGTSHKPVYLFIHDGKAELKDATYLWGKNTRETEELLYTDNNNRHIKFVCIGPGGEACSLISSIVADGARVAARAGVGAVMGSKKLKAIVVKGNNKIKILDTEQFNKLRKDTLEHLRDIEHLPFIRMISGHGTCSGISMLVPSGAAPIKNWSLIGEEAFPNYAKINGESFTKYQLKRTGCGNCPINCGGILHVKDGPFATKGRKPEYETIGAFGTMCLNTNAESIIRANDICDLYGIDTISAGSTIAFAMECYENGIISKADTEGIELNWGNAPAIVAMIEKMAKRQGFGKVLADGVERAAKQIGRGAEKYAIHVHGQEPGLHDPRFFSYRGLGYLTDAIPGRHMTSYGSIRMQGEGKLGSYPELQAPKEGEGYELTAKIHSLAASYGQTFINSGMCLYALGPGTKYPLVEFISALTGWKFDVAEAIIAGKRTLTLRQAFNVREGLKPKDFNLPDRIAKPPAMGPYAGREIDFDALKDSYYQAMGWDAVTGIPSQQCLAELGLEDLVGILPES